MAISGCLQASVLRCKEAGFWECSLQLQLILEVRANKVPRLEAFHIVSQAGKSGKRIWSPNCHKSILIGLLDD